MTLNIRPRLGRRAWIAAVTVMLPLAVLLTGCTPAADSSECAQAFDKLDSVTTTSGIFNRVSDKVADTLNHCGSVAEWNGALTSHPQVVGVKSVPADQLNDYLASACGLLPGAGAENQVCKEARASGFIEQ